MAGQPVLAQNNYTSPTTSYNLSNLINVNGTLYFTADSGMGINELMRLDTNGNFVRVEYAQYSYYQALPPLPELDASELSIKPHPARSGSMGTVKLQRRAKLAEKLREVFSVEGIEEVVAGAFHFRFTCAHNAQ